MPLGSRYLGSCTHGVRCSPSGATIRPRLLTWTMRSTSQRQTEITPTRAAPAHTSTRNSATLILLSRSSPSRRKSRQTTPGFTTSAHCVTFVTKSVIAPSQALKLHSPATSRRSTAPNANAPSSFSTTMASHKTRTNHDRPRTTLVTGFDPFGGRTSNPSADLVRLLEPDLQDNVRVAILPTSYRRSWERMRNLIAEHKPTTVVMFGYSRRVKGLRLERFARNRDRSREPDN